MSFDTTIEIVGIIISVVGGGIGVFAWLLKFIIRPTIELYRNQKRLLKEVGVIKKEVTPNGGSSIKDIINRIDRRQVMIDKRSKAIFYNVDDPILEVDEHGNILWANQKFHDLLGSKNVKGLDWVSYIDEPQRENFLTELESCSTKVRELKFETNSTDGKRTVFLGFPYRDNDKNYGFLIYIKGE
jgi:PAS domain S-box-containing protein